MDATLPVAGDPSKSWIAKQRDQFTADWHAGLEPRIEEILTKLPPDYHETVLGELLTVEIDLRRRRGDCLQRREYEDRFPAVNRQLLDGFQSAFAIDPEKTLTNADLGTSANRSGEGSTVTAAARFRDLRLFRKGGLGALFRAHDESLHREAVVKFMNENCEHDPAMQTQFRVEAEITSRLDHPGIVPVYGSGEDWHGRPFYVMRLINGRELREPIQEYHQAGGPNQRSSKNRQMLFGLLEHLVSACNTIAYAHHAGIVHCDIKPANIMIGKYGETLVLDWGLASPFERSATFMQPGERTIRPNSLSNGSSSEQRGGTYGYISPEQLSSDAPLTPTSDVYSLGATLYEILVGRAPFCGRDRDVGEKIRLGQFPTPRSVQRYLPRGLEAICLKAMNLSPQERYPSAKHLAADLTNWMRDERIAALPDRWWNRAARWARHHWGLTVAVLLVAFATLVAGGSISRYVNLAAHDKVEKQGFTRALNTFEDLCRPLGNEQLNGLAAFDPIRANIGGFANDYLDRFGKTASMRLHTARVLELRATVAQVDAKDIPQAAKDYEQAELLYRQLTPADGDDLQNGIWLAHCRLGWGRLCVHRPASGKLESMQYNEQARALLTAAAESYQRLREQLPSDTARLREQHTALLRDLAEAHHCLGEAWYSRDDEETRAEALKKAEEHFNLGKQIRMDLIKETAGAARHDLERDVARSLGYLGDLYLAQGKVPEATEAYEGSLDRRKRLYDNSHDPEHRFQYARGLANFGTLDVGYRGEFSMALDRLKEAIELQRALTREFPDVGKFSRDLAATLTTQAELLLLAAGKETDPAQAVEYRRQGLEAAAAAAAIYRPGGQRSVDREHISGLALNLVTTAALQSNDPAKSQQLAAQAESLLLTLASEDGQLRSDLVTLALARSLQGRGDSAIIALKEAVRRGENTAERVERHSACGFRALATHSRLGPQFQDLCEKVRETLKGQ
jgi:tetratricopeptide (TPR) repeat protein